MTDGWTVPGFTLVRELGSDASGRQVLAVDELTRTQVTIRYLAAGLVRDDAFQQRMSWLSQLEDDNLVQVYELVDNGADAAIVSEYFEGVPLRRLLTSSLDPESAVVILSDILLGLTAAHAKGIVHGDCNPDRVLIAPDGRAKLNDLCIAVSTGKGAPAGNPAYQAPERWQGSPQSPQADIYAATAVFVECLTGRRLFPGTSTNALGKAHTNSPIPVVDVPGPLRSLVLRGLAKEPGKRPDSAPDFLTELDDAVSPVFGADWEKRGRARIRELAQRSATAASLNPQKGSAASTPARQAPKQQKAAPGPAETPVAPAEDEPTRHPKLLVGGIAAALFLASAAAYAMNGDGDKAQAGPTPTTSTSKSAAAVPTTTEVSKELTGADLAKKISTGVLSKGTAAVSIRRVTGRQTTTAQGGVQFPQADLKVSLSGPGAMIKRQAVLLGSTLYVQNGARWDKLPMTAKGYPQLANQARWAASLDSLTAVLNGTETITRKGNRFEGAVPSAPDLTAIAPGYRKAKVKYELLMASGWLPKQIKLTITAPGKPKITVTTTYSNWGANLNLKPPR